MDIKFDITMEDYLVFTRYCYKKSPLLKRNYWMNLIVAIPLIVILFSVGFYLCNLIAPELLTFTSILFSALTIIFIIIWIFTFPSYYYKFLEKQMKKLIKEGNNKGIFGEHTITLQDDGFLESTTFNESLNKWGAVESIEQDQAYLYIFIGSVNAHIIPKREFESQEQCVKFFETAMQLWKISRDRIVPPAISQIARKAGEKIE